MVLQWLKLNIEFPTLGQQHSVLKISCSTENSVLNLATQKDNLLLPMMLLPGLDVPQTNIRLSRAERTTL